MRKGGSDKPDFKLVMWDVNLIFDFKNSASIKEE